MTTIQCIQINGPDLILAPEQGWLVYSRWTLPTLPRFAVACRRNGKAFDVTGLYLNEDMAQADAVLRTIKGGDVVWGPIEYDRATRLKWAKLHGNGETS
jgi:hypothetical protein